MFRCCRCCNSENRFSYQNICAGHVEDQRYYIEQDPRGCITLLRKYSIDNIPPNFTINTGWKFHIAINIYDIEIAWNAIKEIIMRHNLLETKIYPLTVILEQNWPEHDFSRAFTLYAFKEVDTKNFIPIIAEIESALARAGVRQLDNPGQACTFLPNSNYVAYRCDRRAIEAPETDPGGLSLYISPEEAVERAAETGTQPWNPYKLPLPQYLVNLIVARQAIEEHDDIAAVNWVCCC